ncbi:hypothetical protein AVEN_59824-1 [Araneus ventricosus]|uniref:Uncharacterized protein n=1 Tax=Araneus ventricosus TaxID=182803 RepID=A0A4Y2MQF5_ARAVE|nr:hypothetical protein AVEN_59824-1 [Araneus ventricosus]
MSATNVQEKFLSNDKNKQRLINMLCVKFQKEGFVVKQAEEDVDYLMIKNALEIEKESLFVAVVGEDVDLLVIMTTSTNSENSFSPHIRNNILFLHAFGGCDTTSALFRQGKKKFINSTELQAADFFP